MSIDNTFLEPFSPNKLCNVIMHDDPCVVDFAYESGKKIILTVIVSGHLLP